MPLSLPIEAEATKLLHDSPLALLLGMLLDQQIPMEKAFSSPYVLKQRLGHDLDAREIATFDPEAFEAIVAKPPALHRFPRANAKRIQEMCQVLVERYDGEAANIWTGVDSGQELVRRMGQLPGFGSSIRCIAPAGMILVTTMTSSSVPSLRAMCTLPPGST